MTNEPDGAYDWPHAVGGESKAELLAEITRLRERLKYIRFVLTGSDTADEKKAVDERMKELNDLDAENDNLRDEIARLRGLLEAAEKTINHFRETASPAREAGREPSASRFWLDKFGESARGDVSWSFACRFAEAYAESRLSTVVEVLREFTEIMKIARGLGRYQANRRFLELEQRAEATLRDFPPEPKP